MPKTVQFFTTSTPNNASLATITANVDTYLPLSDCDWPQLLLVQSLIFFLFHSLMTDYGKELLLSGTGLVMCKEYIKNC